MAPSLWRDCPTLVVATAALVVAMLATGFIALQPFDQPFIGIEPVSWIVAAGMIAGGGFMLLPGTMPYLVARPDSLYWVLGIGLALRLMMMIPEPILEIDYTRYLWDGAVINAGFSPYGWSPGEIISGAGPEALSRLAKASSGVIDEINYPQLTTIYPPAAEFIFAVTNWIRPWDLMVWRLVILAFEMATLALLHAVLVQLGRPPHWLILYWWNPVVIMAFSNAAHMDAILLPALLGATLFAIRARGSLAAVCLALAAAVKLWPLLLLPTLTRSPRAAALFALVATVLLWPFISQAFQTDAGQTDTGLRAYGGSWERNAALFHALLGGLRSVLDGFGLFALDAGRILRAAVGVAVVMIALGINRRAAADGETMVRRMVVVIAAILLLGPTLYPWYYTWMVPFLAIVPIPGLLAFSVVLPLYYLQFHPWFQDHSQVFTDYVVWLEQGPIFILLLMAWRARRRADP